MEHTPRQRHAYRHRRFGIFCAIISALCLALFILSIYPRYVMDDLFHALHVDVGNGWLPMVFYCVWTLSTMAAYLSLRPNRGWQTTVAPLVLLILVIAVAAFVLWPVMTKASESPRFRRTSCIGHQRQIAMMMAMYAHDHNGHLPATWDDLQLDPKWLVDPLTRRYFHRRGGYGYNTHARGVVITGITDPSALLLTADALRPTSYLTSASDIDRARHGEKERGYIAAFADGHADFLPAATPTSLR